MEDIKIKSNFHNFAKIAYKLKRKIKAIDLNGEFKIFNSKNQTAKYYGISSALVFLICERKNRCKSAFTTLGRITFFYANDDDVVTDTMINLNIGRTKFINDDERKKCSIASTKKSIAKKQMFKTWLISFKRL